MRKRVLALYYSQSGQTYQVLKALMRPFEDQPDVEITWAVIEPSTSFPFPWPVWRFFDAMPECVLMETAGQDVRMNPPSDGKPFDLVVISYQVWFLSPSLPVSTFLRSSQALVLKDTPVVTVVNARDKWVLAQEKMTQLLASAGAKLVGHIAVIPNRDPLTNLLTTLRWLWLGKKGPFWRFPAAGLNEREIGSLECFGRVVFQALYENKMDGLEFALERIEAAPINEALYKQEVVGNRVLRWWARKIRGHGKKGVKRKVLLMIFIGQLCALIGLSMPISLFFHGFRCFRDQREHTR